MTKLAPSPSRLLVLDLETRPDPQAVQIAPRGREMSRVALHRIMGFSALAATEQVDGEWGGFKLLSAVDEDEHALLLMLDGQLAHLADGGGLLVTYNGISHDCAVLRRRAAAHWLFGLPGLDRLDELGHRDLLREHARGRGSAFPSLRDACAGYGIPTDHRLQNHNRPIPAEIRKSQVDCVATFLLTLYELALERGCETPLVQGWTALARFLGQPEHRAPHLDQFRYHPMLAAALET